MDPISISVLAAFAGGVLKGFKEDKARTKAIRDSITVLAENSGWLLVHCGYYETWAITAPGGHIKHKGSKPYILRTWKNYYA